MIKTEQEVENIVKETVDYFYNKNFFWNKERLENWINTWKKYCENWDKEALSYTEDQITKIYEEIIYWESYNNFLLLGLQINSWDPEFFDAIRYSNSVTLRIFTKITWINAEKKSNKELENIKNEYIEKYIKTKNI